MNLIGFSEEAIADALRIGADVTEAEELLSKAGAAYEEGRVDEATEMAKRSLESAKKTKEDYFISGAPIIFSSLQRSKKRKKGLPLGH